MRVLRKTWVLILIDVLLFTVTGIMLLYAFLSLTREKEILIVDKAYNGILILLVSTSILHIIVSILEFINKKMIKGLLILFYTPFKLYLIWAIWIFYIIIRAGGPPIDDIGEIKILEMNFLTQNIQH